MGRYNSAALVEMSRGQAPSIVLISKKEIEKVLNGGIRLDTLIEGKVRR